jgi:hypothetical protein
VNIHVKMFNPQQTVSKILDDSVGTFTAETWGRCFNPYVPMQSGMLSKGYRTEPFKVIYDSPYAHKMYEGDNFNFSKEQHPLATSHWNEPAFTAKKDIVAKEISTFIARK